MKRYINTLIFLACAFAAFAQAPQKFNYQAVARNAQGAVLPNQNVKIRASILDGSANGTSQYSETHSITTSQLGLLNLAIGGGAVVSGNFADISWASGDKYLKIEMDATGGNNFSLVGTSQLLSVPYALNAGNGSQWRTTNANPGSAGIDEAITYQNFVTIGDPTLGTNNLLPGLTGNSLTVIGKDIYGAQIPLQFVGNVDSMTWGANGSFGTYGRIIRISQIKATNPVVSGLSYDLGIDENEALFITEKNGYNPAFTVNGSNIGINTDTPKAKLQVTDGDVYIENVNNGVIMKSPNGQCWRMTVSNIGQPVFTSITCPQ